MRKLLAAVFAVSASIGMAQASTIDVTIAPVGSSVALTDFPSPGPICTITSCGITASLSAGFPAGASYSLAEGQTAEIDFIDFELYGTGFGVYSITATLALSAPPISATSSGGGFYAVILGTVDIDAGGGSLSWASVPQQFTLANGSIIEIDFEEGSTFFLGDPITTKAYITAVSIVPLPAAGLMLVGALGLLPVMSRRRRKAA